MPSGQALDSASGLCAARFPLLLLSTRYSGFSFDAATFELWGALLHGGRLVGISKDITERKTAEEQLEQELEKYLSVVSAVAHTIWVCRTQRARGCWR